MSKHQENEANSKLSRFPEYETEYNVNCELLKKITAHHTTTLNIKSDGETPSIYIKYRLKDLLVSITDDLIRYARYHSISKEKRTSDRSIEIYSISENVRASFFVKWILKLKPCILDHLAPVGSYKSSQENSPDASKKVRDDDYHHIKFCNEYLSMVALSIIINVKYDDADAVVEFQQFFNGIDLSTLFYSLRYRVTHQDSYTLLFSRVSTFADEESFKLK